MIIIIKQKIVLQVQEESIIRYNMEDPSVVLVLVHTVCVVSSWFIVLIVNPEDHDITYVISWSSGLTITYVISWFSGLTINTINVGLSKKRRSSRVVLHHVLDCPAVEVFC